MKEIIVENLADALKYKRIFTKMDPSLMNGTILSPKNNREVMNALHGLEIGEQLFVKSDYGDCMAERIESQVFEVRNNHYSLILRTQSGNSRQDARQCIDREMCRQAEAIDEFRADVRRRVEGWPIR